MGKPVSEWIRGARGTVAQLLQGLFEILTRGIAGGARFGIGAVGIIVPQFLSMAVRPVGLGKAGAQTYYFATGVLDSGFKACCKPNCLYREHSIAGDRFPYPAVGSEDAVVRAWESEPCKVREHGQSYYLVMSSAGRGAGHRG